LFRVAFHQASVQNSELPIRATFFIVSSNTTIVRHQDTPPRDHRTWIFQPGAKLRGADSSKSRSSAITKFAFFLGDRYLRSRRNVRKISAALAGM
jgi:hypothetical protein